MPPDSKERLTHRCHWPTCNRYVPPMMWGCKTHWFALPKYLRDKIWAEYRLGQEIRKDPSEEYMEVYNEVQEWIETQVTKRGFGR